MIVYFSASTRNIVRDLGTYRRICDKIRALGHGISNDWVETEYKRQKGAGVAQWDIENLAKDALLSIEGSEILITEASSGSTVGVGYEIAYALQQKKPVLALVNGKNVQDSYVRGINHELLTCKLYNNNEELDELVESFIMENTISTKDLRFNFVIDRKIHNHLRWRSFKTGKTKAEVVRDLLLKDIESNNS